MAEVLSPPATSQSPSPHNAPPPQPRISPMADAESNDHLYFTSSILSPQPRTARQRPAERTPSFARSRMSQYSVQSQNTSRSRPDSSAFLPFPSSLSYTVVRDFAYPPFNPMHAGPPPAPPSGSSTPGSDFTGSRRMSDPMDSWNAQGSRGAWVTGSSWAGDGEDGVGSGGESLPATSFGEPEDDADTVWGPRGKHQKSKSYANMTDFERGRRRDSGHRKSGAHDMYFFSGPQNDPAGIDSLRYSRSGLGSHRRDSHLAGTLPPRSFHHSQEFVETPLDSTSSFPLDMLHRSHSPSSPSSDQQIHRESMGEDELFSGRSIALYDFQPENPNELALREGQEIMVSYRHGQGWLVAEDPQTGEQGLVPEAYVRLVRDLDMDQWYQDGDDADDSHGHSASDGIDGPGAADAADDVEMSDLNGAEGPKGESVTDLDDGEGVELRVPRKEMSETESSEPDDEDDDDDNDDDDEDEHDGPKAQSALRRKP